jgi:hypothetical protein
VPVHSVSKFFSRDLSRSKINSSEKNQSNPTDLSTKFDECGISPLRCVPTIAIYTLAALTAQDLTHQALATELGVTNQPSINKANNQDVVTVKELPAKVATKIANPELVAQEFSQNSLPTAKSNIQVVVATTPGTSRTITPTETKLTLSPTTAANFANVTSKSAQDLQKISTINISQTTNEVVGQNIQPNTTTPCLEVDGLRTQLREVEKIKNNDEFQASPGLSISIPTGFGADNNTGFVSATYQQRTRFSNVSDGAVGVGIGLGDARKAVGVELSYTAASFGGSRDFGGGGFNVKVHRQLADDLAVAAGWNGFVNIGGRNDFENSVYGTATKIFRTRDDINKPFSRVAVTAGIGNGQFRSENAVARDSDGVGVFGNVAVRVVQPVSLIAEWSGQDLGVGVSFVPFKNLPFVITPAVRDITGAGDGPRFVLGTGVAFKF